MPPMFFQPFYLPMKNYFSRLNLSVILSLTIFIIYLMALSPSIYVGDSSLLAAASFSLGSAHPPGYPLYVIIGKLFTFLPFGSVAYKVNLVNAVFAALACLMVFKASMELTNNIHASWASALLCGISPLFFKESIKAEVYTLNSFLAMVVFYLGLKILTLEVRPGENEAGSAADACPGTGHEKAQFYRFSLSGIFIIGLGMGNHHTIGFMGIIFLWPIAVMLRHISARWLFFSLLVFVLGFSVNLFLYFRSTAIVNNGGLILYSYAGTFKSLSEVLLRQAYAGSSSADALSGVVHSGHGWFYGLKNSLLYAAYSNTRYVWPALLLGILYMFKRCKILCYFAVSAVVWFLLLGKMVFSSPKPAITDIQTVGVYFLPVIPILYCLVSQGFAAALGFLNKIKGLEILPKFAPYMVAALPFVFLPFSFGPLSLNNNFLAEDYGRDMLVTLPLKSLLLNYTDNPMFTIFYMRAVERYREDVLVMNTAGTKDTYGIESSPQWKYETLYPDFYKKEKISIKEINRDFALKGRLFTASVQWLTQGISRHYTHYPYVLTSVLYPVNVDRKDRGFRDAVISEIKLNFPKINFEQVIELPYQEDSMAKELQDLYSYTTMVYGDILKRGGDEKGGDHCYKMAFMMREPRSYLWPFISFLLEDGRQKEAFALLKEVKKAGGYGKFAELLERKAVSACEKNSTQNRVAAVQ